MLENYLFCFYMQIFTSKLQSFKYTINNDKNLIICTVIYFMKEENYIVKKELKTNKRK